mmetsp:Transcript_28976/g.74356  ORF Transcript_28976/g.74356 Transcript_28976/m.74356 type:complete len:353 (-) Transcript_28976:592-1650(-)
MTGCSNRPEPAPGPSRYTRSEPASTWAGRPAPSSVVTFASRMRLPPAVCESVGAERASFCSVLDFESSKPTSAASRATFRVAEPTVRMYVPALFAATFTCSNSPVPFFSLMRLPPTADTLAAALSSPRESALGCSVTSRLVSQQLPYGSQTCTRRSFTMAFNPPISFHPGCTASLVGRPWVSSSDSESSANSDAPPSPARSPTTSCNDPTGPPTVIWKLYTSPPACVLLQAPSQSLGLYSSSGLPSMLTVGVGMPPSQEPLVQRLWKRSRASTSRQQGSPATRQLRSAPSWVVMPVPTTLMPQEAGAEGRACTCSSHSSTAPPPALSRLTRTQHVAGSATHSGACSAGSGRR